MDTLLNLSAKPWYLWYKCNGDTTDYHKAIIHNKHISMYSQNQIHTHEELRLASVIVFLETFIPIYGKIS